jgi:hypothetical protein
MRTTGSRRAFCRPVYLGFWLAFAGNAMPAFGQTTTLSDAWAAYLRPGCRVLLVLPATKLEVQTKWLGPITVSQLAQRYRGVCPSEPVAVDGVEFGPPALDVLRIQSGLGRDFLRFHARGLPASENETTAHSSAGHHGQIPSIQARIEMHYDNQLGLEDRGFEDRWYDIRYQSDDESLSGQVRIHCGASRDFATRAGQINPQKRYCGAARLPRFHGVIVNYDLTQWRLLAPESISTDPTTEPGAILQFDKRFREWFVSLER